MGRRRYSSDIVAVRFDFIWFVAAERIGRFIRLVRGCVLVSGRAGEMKERWAIDHENTCIVRAIAKKYDISEDRAKRAVKFFGGRLADDEKIFVAKHCTCRPQKTSAARGRG